jgi:hypothetical protein
MRKMSQRHQKLADFRKQSLSKPWEKSRREGSYRQ